MVAETRLQQVVDNKDSDEATAPLGYCPDCAERGVKSPVAARRISEEMAILKCSRPPTECLFPMEMEHELFKKQIVPVSSLDASVFRRTFVINSETSSSAGSRSPNSFYFDDSVAQNISAINEEVLKVSEETLVVPIDHAAATVSSAKDLNTIVSPPSVSKVIVEPFAQDFPVKTCTRKRKLEEKEPRLTTEKIPTRQSSSALMQHVLKRTSNSVLNLNSKPSAVETQSAARSLTSGPSSKTVYRSLTSNSTTKQTSSVGYFPGYIPSSDAKSDLSNDSNERQKVSSKVVLSASVKRLIKSNIVAASIQQNFSPMVEEKANSMVNPTQERETFDFNDPFSSYEMFGTPLDNSYYSTPTSTANSSAGATHLLDPSVISSALIGNDVDDGFFSFSATPVEPDDGDLFQSFSDNYHSL